MSEDPLKEDRKNFKASLEESFKTGMIYTNQTAKEPRVSMWEVEEKLKVIERLQYIMKDNSLKQSETIKLIELRDKLINGLV